MPLITVPYLVRILGPAQYGEVSFGQSLIAYFGILVDYGFSLSATRKISIERRDSLAVSQTSFNVWAAKTFICLAGFCILLILVTFIPRLSEISILLLILYGTVIGNVLFPIWLFQGMEKMVYISEIKLFSNFLMVIGVFSLVHQPDDYLIYAGLTSLASLMAGVVGVAAAFLIFRIPPNMPTFKGIQTALSEGFMVFISMASVSFYTVGNAFILGILTNNSAVGYYSAAEQIVKAIIGLLGPISQATYPRFSRMALEARDLAIQWGQRMLLLMGGLGLILSACVFAGAPIIVRIILGPEYEPSIGVMRILAGLCFLIAASNVLGIQIMIPFGKDRAFACIIFSAGLLNIILAILLAPIWRENGMALAVLFTEAFVTGAMLFYLSRCQINLLRWPIIADKI